ncbi:cytochrome P450 [Streptomyces sp. NPDC048337]|uniref:cytochrome P450 n=1 Tax=Streptomyces sp. NPDC048337 TaxID=3365535 RepID=UPI003714341D
MNTQTTRQPSDSIPVAPGALPVLGHALPLLRDPLRFLTRLPAHGDLVRIGLGPVPVVVVCDADLTDHVLRHDRIFDKGGPFFERAREVLGNGMGTCPYSVHRRQRRLLQPSFARERMPGYAEVMTQQISALTDTWRDGQILDVYSELLRHTSTVTTTTLFSDMVDDTTGRHAGDDVNTLTGGIFRRMLMPPPLDRLPTPGNRAFGHARARLHATLDGIIADRRRDITDRGDLLSALLAARDTDGRGLSDSDIADQIITFFGAGTETTASALAWALYLLDRHPRIADRLHHEVDTVLAGRPARHADMPHLTLTGRIITEVMRLYPPAWLLTRVVSEDTELGGRHLRAGTNLAYSAYALHRRGDLYRDPDCFDPDRWDPGRAQPARTALIPFGGGARKCIGDVFAVTEATLSLATISARWHLRTFSGGNVRPARAAVLHPRGLHMRATARTQRPRSQ